ncbi:nucleotide-diphospho-sugar transferase [Boletus reticuloceps]|uniref:Nucleotide-diphospho-sugar transferase n=1 Tax=Boletus reticuloceps TaxID=495285 RepID=A0A8I2YTM6_9AGAM|nr:nucleotide-diphospho-sugar transferase [Boletus reticuloceps]
MSHIPRSLPTQGDTTTSALSVEVMFAQILGAVEKSQAEISELRQECAELRLANTSLERQVKEGLNNHHVNGSRFTSTPGSVTPVPGSPQLRAKSPFLSPHNMPALAVVPPSLLTPSPLGDNAVTAVPISYRDIPGFYVVIPAGGAGTRLWPKVSDSGHLGSAVAPVFSASYNDRRWSRDTSSLSTNNYRISFLTTSFVSLDRRTPWQPSVSQAAILAKRDPDAIIGSFAADHMISGDDAFLSAIIEAVEVAKKDYLVTIGIAPSHPSTAFGYIRLGDGLGLKQAPNARLVSSFKEKPDARTAAAYIGTGNYRWNAGMFVTKATVLMDLLKNHKPDLHDGLQKIASVWGDEEKGRAALAEVWPGLEKIAIDHAVAEPAAAEGKVAVVPATFGWDDVGDFSSLADLLPAESNQPRVLGDNNFVLTEQVAGGIVVPGSGRLIACLGVDDLVIVDMPDTLLVTTRARSQEVKRLVKKCRDAGWKTLL